ncbi:MAG: prepilin-type N-terminal cleavage/methylation domain-containing protein [Planctomycetes bacterium]|nr:prepilin-type N-terminal cleavage/methylation domain-containing protein [Planctomycetota bacterium]
MKINGRRCGFSLIELLGVVAIVALLASVVGVRYYQRMEKTVLRGAAYRVLNMAQYGRLLAGEGHRPCRLNINLTEGTYWLTELLTGIPVDDESFEEGGQELTISDQYARPSVLPEGIRFKQVELAGMALEGSGEVAIEFRADGTAEASVIEIGGDKRVYRVVIEPWTGRAEIQVEGLGNRE